MASSVKPGDTVQWNTSQGLATGTVERKVTTTTKVKKHVAKATKPDPQFKVKSKTSGKTAIHRPQALTKI